MLLIYLGLGPIICYPLVDCLVAPAICGAIANCLHILVASLLSCSRLVIASPLPRCRLAPPFTRHHHHRIRRRHPTRKGSATAIAIVVVGCYPYRFCRHHQRRFSCRRLRCPHCQRTDASVTADAPAVGRDEPDSRRTKTRYGTASAAAASATEEEEYDRCDGVDP